MTTTYEVFDLLEIGSAGTTILEKCVTDLDELGEPVGMGVEGLNE